jgi:Asp-tRNA(Asn)/Glu-tRNA(Gln) amidotransferase A subunit family amidase
MHQPLTIAEAVAEIRSGRLQPLQLVEQCLAQIERYDDRLRAWVEVDREGAQAAAELLGAEAARGQFRGPLHGIPVGIKDIIDVEGFPTRAGSPLPAKRSAPDAPLVAALRRAGAIILGKTVTVEFACFDPPPTRNPWDPALKHTPGGSSSGSAVALAMGMCLGALGTQTGGSLVRPASFCGVAACKPTFGLLSTDGVVPVSFHLDHPGPMARTAADLEILLQCLLGSAAVSGAAGREHAPAPAGRPPRLGLLEQFFLERADPLILEATETALATLREAGALIEPVVFPSGFDEVLPIHRRIMAVEAAAYHRERFAAHRASYGPMITTLLDEGLTISGVDYAAALAQQREFRRRIDVLFEGVDALVAPATDTTAPATLATTGPNTFQAPWSVAGVPVVSIPCGLAADGMPAALQLVARAHQEASLLRIARWCEQQLAFDKLPAIWGA